MRTALHRHLRQDAGYVLALGGMLIIPLMIAVGFAVDVGAWYSRAGQLQKVADAASLGGVVWMPDQAAAESAARTVLGRNGFPDTDGDDLVDGTDVQIVFEYPGAQQFGVRLVDPTADLFFSSVILDAVDIQRRAVAEYVLPVAMGSPRNFLGTGNDPGGAIPGALHENFWLAISGPCASRENGDAIQAMTDQNYQTEGANPALNPGPVNTNTPWVSCTGGYTADMTGSTETFRQNGYFYAVEVPASAAGNSLYIQVYDAPQCNTGGSPYSNGNDGRNTNNGTGGSSAHYTRYRVRGPDLNPYRPDDNPVVGGPINMLHNSDTYCGTAGSDWQNKWMTLYSTGSAEAGVYFVQVQSDSDNNDANAPSATGSDDRHQSNQFSLRASYTSSWTEATSPCSTRVSDGAYFNANCPQVYAIDLMGVYANLGGTYPSFFLAEVGPEHNGKTLEIDLFDPGEGTVAMEVIDPIGRSVDFDWEVINRTGSETAPTGGWSGTVNQPGSDPFCASAPPACSELDVLGNPNTAYTSSDSGYYRGWNPQPGPYRGSRSKYSDRAVHIEVQLPDDIAAEYSGEEWWRVRYTLSPVSGNITDRTTWTVNVSGDPIRLIE